MNITTAINKVKKKGVKGTVKYCIKKVPFISGHLELSNNSRPENEAAFKILLLTNRDSDNVGDQVIEACDIGLIAAVMKNLDIDNYDYKIISREAAIVSQKYMSTRSPELLQGAEDLIENSDVVIFGGAPMFNYLYQSFYERTSVILELANKHHTPVVFSAIGIEGYHENNKKCQRLKRALNSGCVKQITTRDNFESLLKYKENENFATGKVADPAVFSSQIFKKYMTEKNPDQNKKIGLFILRANGFVDNKINFTREQAATFWTELISELTNRGYDYELITSGHFGDEAFIDYLIRKYNVNAGNCVFNVNSPEKLIQKISSYDAVVSCRLHPSIISFSLDVPCIGINWNVKVKGFYDSIGYGNRTVDIEAEGRHPAKVADKIEQAMKQGVKKDNDYLMSVYHSLFNTLKELVYSDSGNCDILPYRYDELINNIPEYSGTSKKELDNKVKRKFRRTYSMYNERFDRYMQYKDQIDELKAENKQLKEALKQK